jgi:hypothetical protein
MSVLAYVHQLFNVDQCQAYIHTLRWKDRPLQCPRCQSQDVDPWGQYHYPYSQNIRTHVPTGAYAPTVARTSACLLHPSRPYLAHYG